jgi:hypothetical protein|tara:strand:- start:34 stop:366 length:333 start_codon:yes stop_codon:yes gene_type:complete
MIITILYSASWSEELMVLIMIILSTMFYSIIFFVIIGFKTMSIVEGRMSTVWQVRTILLLALYMLYDLGYAGAFYYSLPYMLMGLSADLFATAISLGLIEYESYEDEDDE